MLNFGKDFKWTAFGKQVDKTLDQLLHERVKAGYDDSSGSYEDGTSVAEVAEFNEYGTVDIPSRPFMRNAADKQKDHLPDMAKLAWKGITTGTADSLLKNVGELYKQDLQDEIDSGNYAPNAPSTIAQKGSDHPLIDTGRMHDSIVVKVERK